MMMKKDLFIKHEEDQNDNGSGNSNAEVFKFGSNLSSRVNSTRNGNRPSHTPLNNQRQTIGFPLADPFMKLSPNGLLTSKSKRGFFQNDA